MKIYPRRQKLFKVVTFLWIVVFILNSFLGIYFLKTPNLNYFFFFSILFLIFFKSFFNAFTCYPQALRGELVFGNLIADFIFIFRQLSKPQRINKKY